MIVFGVCAGPTGKFERIAGPSIDRVRQQDDEVMVLTAQSSISVAYNQILDRARAHGDELEAVVLIHDDVELRDPDIHDKLRSLFTDRSIGVAGVIGAAGVRSLEWWRYDTHGRVHEDRSGLIDFGWESQDVDMVDGLLLAVAPIAARSLRFDESYGGFHGYDGDFCASARASGLRVVVTDIDVAHRTSGGYGDRDAFDAADDRFKRKWVRRNRRLGMRSWFSLR